MVHRFYSVQIEVVDVFGAYIGSIPLWIVNNATSDNPGEWEYDPFPI
jgi:hypothetical protein